MKSFIELVEKKIKNNLQIDKIEIIDNTHKHLKHKSYNKDKLHLKIAIKSNFLKTLNKIEAHKKIMNILDEELKSKIHSLEIKIN
jgi:BolA protein